MIYNYKKFLEKKINKIDLDTIFNKYYSKLNRNDFEKIVSADPTSLIDGTLYMGRYSKWLVDLYTKDKLKLEDLYKATEYLILFDKQSVKNKIKRKNINDYNNLSDLAKELEPFKDSEEILSKSELKDKNFIQEFNNFNLYIPRTYKDNCVLGKGTEWCTATEKTDIYYKQYHRKGRELLIFINKEDLKEKYQLHLRSEQFMDKFDGEVVLVDWLKHNKDIKKWLKTNYSTEYKRYFRNCVNLNLYRKNLTTLKDLNLPKKVEGNFSCSFNNLTTLEGAPEIVEGRFNCHHNNLTSLEYAPKIVEGGFHCYRNNLTSLEGAPKKVEGDFFCSSNLLTTLEGAPKIVEGNFICYSNELTTLEGAPEIVKGDFDCSDNKLPSLVGAPKIVEGDFHCRNNNLTEKDIEWLKQNCEIRGKIIW